MASSRVTSCRVTSATREPNEQSASDRQTGSPRLAFRSWLIEHTAASKISTSVSYDEHKHFLDFSEGFSQRRIQYGEYGLLSLFGIISREMMGSLISWR